MEACFLISADSPMPSGVANMSEPEPEPEIAITICWPIDHHHAEAVRRNGPVVHSVCHECGRGVIANVSEIGYIAERGMVSVPLCEPCAMSPGWRSILRTQEIECTPEMSLN